MKLHLPKLLRNSVLACITAVAGIATTTVGTATFTGGVVAFALSSQQALALTVDNVAQTWDSDSEGDLGNVIVQGAEGTLTITGGTHTSSTLLELKNAGSVTLDGGTLNFSQLHLHNQGTSTEEVFTVQSGTLNLSYTDDGVENPNQTGAVALVIGHWHHGSSNFNLNGGTVNAVNGTVRLGWDSTGRLNVAGGVLNTKGITFRNDGDDSRVLNLSGTGRINLGSVGVKASGYQANNTITLTSGTIGTISEGGTIIDATNITTTIGAITIDTNVWDAATSTSTETAANISLLGTVTAADESSTITLAGAGSFTIDSTLNTSLALAEGSTAKLRIESVDGFESNYTLETIGGYTKSGYSTGVIRLLSEGKTTGGIDKVWWNDTAYDITDGTFTYSDGLYHVAESIVYGTEFSEVEGFKVLSSGTLSFADSTLLSKLHSVEEGGTAVLTTADGSKDLLYFSGVCGNGSIGVATIEGSTVTLNGADAGFVGDVTIASGTTVKFASRDALGNSYHMLADRVVRIQDGATLDINGQEAYYHIVLEDGATLKNGASGEGGRNLPYITLEGDATIDAQYTMKMNIGNPGNGTIRRLDLGGHTLTKTGAGEFKITSSTALTAGTFVIQQGTVVLTGSGENVTGCENVDFVVHSGAKLYSWRSARNLKSLTTLGDGDGAIIGVDDDHAMTVAGVTNAHAILRKQGNQGLTLNAAILRKGAQVEGGTLTLNGETYLGKAITVSEGATLNVSASGSVILQSLVNYGATGSVTVPTTNGLVTKASSTYTVVDNQGGTSNLSSVLYGGTAYDVSDAGTITASAKVYYVVENDKLVTVGGGTPTTSTADAAEFYVGDDGTLVIAGDARTNYTAADVLSTVQGTGKVNLATDVSFNGVKKNFYFEGDVCIQSGYVVRFGEERGDDEKGTRTVSFTGGVELAGGRLMFQGASLTIPTLTSADDASILHLFDRDASSKGVDVNKLVLTNDLLVTSRLDGTNKGWKYTLNVGELSGNGDLTAKAGETGIVNISALNSFGGQLTFEDKVTGNVTINAGQSLSKDKIIVSGSGRVVLFGEGTYDLGSSVTIPSGVSLADSWTGVVNVSGHNAFGGTNPEALTKGLNSYVGLTGVSGWWSQANNTAKTYDVNLVLSNALITNGDGGFVSYAAYGQNNGWTGDNRTIAGSVSGDGNWGRTEAIGGKQTWTFAGDVSGWTGKIFNGAGGLESNYKFTGDGEGTPMALNVTIANRNVTETGDYATATHNGVLNIELSNTSGFVVNKSIDATKLTIRSAGGVTFRGNVTVGTLDAASTSITLGRDVSMSVTNGVSIGAEQSLITEGTATMGNALTFNGGSLVLGGALNLGNNALTLSTTNKTTLTLADGIVGENFISADLFTHVSGISFESGSKLGDVFNVDAALADLYLQYDEETDVLRLLTTVAEDRTWVEVEGAENGGTWAEDAVFGDTGAENFAKDDNAIFGTLAANETVTISQDGVEASSVSISAGEGKTYSFAGGALRTPSLTVASGKAVFGNNTLQLADLTTVTVDGELDLTAYGLSAFSNVVTKTTGAGTVKIGSTNEDPGNAGVKVDLTAIDGTNLDLNVGYVIAGNVALDAGTTAETVTVKKNLSVGTIRIQNGTTLVVAYGGELSGSIQLGLGKNQNGGAPVAEAGHLKIENGATVSASGIIKVTAQDSGACTITMNGGTFELTDANTITDIGVDITGGTLQTKGDVSWGITGASIGGATIANTNNGAGVITLTNTTVTGSITGNGKLALAGTVNTTAAATVSGATVAEAGITNSGAGKLTLQNATLAGNITDTGDTTLSGTITTTAADAVTATGVTLGGNEIAAGSKLTLENSTITSTLTNNGALTLSGSVNVTVGGTGPVATYSSTADPTNGTANGNGYQTQTMSYVLISESSTAAVVSGDIAWQVGGKALATGEVANFADCKVLKVTTTDEVNYYINQAHTYTAASADYKTGTVLKLNGAELILDDELDGHTMTVAAANSSIVVNDGVELSSDSITNTGNIAVTLKGLGIYNIGENVVLQKSAVLDSTWAGTVVSSASGIAADTTLALGNKVEFTKDTFTAAGQLTATGVAITGKSLTLQGAENTVGTLELTGALTLGVAATDTAAGVVSKLTADTLDITGDVVVNTLVADMLTSTVGLAAGSSLNLSITEAALREAITSKNLTSLAIGTIADLDIAKVSLNGSASYDAGQYTFSVAKNTAGKLEIVASINGLTWGGNAADPADDNKWSTGENWKDGVAPDTSNPAVKFLGDGSSVVVIGDSAKKQIKYITVDIDGYAPESTELADNDPRKAGYVFTADENTAWNYLEVADSLSVNKGKLTIGSDVNIEAAKRAEVLAAGELHIDEKAFVIALSGISNAGKVTIAASTTGGNAGALNVQDSGSLTNTGTMDVKGTLLAGYGQLHDAEGSNIINSGVLDNEGSVTADGNFVNSGVYTQTAGTMKVYGKLSNTGADIAAPAEGENPTPGMSIAGGTVEVGTLTNSDTVNLSGAELTITGTVYEDADGEIQMIAPSLTNTGAMSIADGAQVTVGSSTFVGSVDNDGTITIGGAKDAAGKITTGMTVYGDLDNENGTIIIGSAATETTEATYGSLEVTGDLDNAAGTLKIEGEGSSVSVDGNLVLADVTGTGEDEEVTSKGTLIVGTGTSLSVGENLVANQMDLAFGGDVTVGGNVNIGSLQNDGVFKTTGDETTTVQIGSLSGSGELNVASGTLSIGSQVNFTGSLTGGGKLTTGSQAFTLLTKQDSVESAADATDIIASSVVVSGQWMKEGAVVTEGTEGAEWVSANGSILGDVTTGGIVIEKLDAAASPHLTLNSLKSTTTGGTVGITLSDLADGDAVADLIAAGAQDYHLFSVAGDMDELVLVDNLSDANEQKLWKSGLKLSDLQTSTTMALRTSDKQVSISVQNQTLDEATWETGNNTTGIGLVVLDGGKLVSNDILDNVQKVTVNKDIELELDGADTAAVNIKGLNGSKDLGIAGDGNTVNISTLTGGYKGELSLDKVAASVSGTVDTMLLGIGTAAALAVDDTVVVVKGTGVKLTGAMEGGTLVLGSEGSVTADSDLSIDDTKIGITKTETGNKLDTGKFATTNDGRTVLANLGSVSGSTADITIGQYDEKTDSFVQSDLYAKYFDTTSYELADGKVVADRNTVYYTSKLADGATSENGAAGLAMADEVLLNANPQGTNATGDLAHVLDQLDALVATGNKAAADELGASLAGASTAVLGMAAMGDVDRQLRAIRNRTTTMGVDQSVVNADMPYFNAWINAEADNREMNDDGTLGGYKLNSYGGTVGFDVDIEPTFTAGMALTAMYGDLDTTGADKASGDVDTKYVSAFARYCGSAWTHTFVATAGMGDISLDRTVAGAKVQGETDSLSFGFMYEVGRVYALDEDGTACLQPVFNVTWKHTTVDAYTEKGGDIALEVGEQTLNTITLGLGARVQAVVGESMYNRTSIFECRLLAKADLGDREGATEVALADSDTYEVKSAEMGAFGLEIGAGLTIPLGDEGSSIFMDASAELRADYTNVNGTVGYRINF